MLDIVRPVTSADDCHQFCGVNAGDVIIILMIQTLHCPGCVAWTLTLTNNIDLPHHCVLYSSVGAVVPYHDSVSGPGPHYVQEHVPSDSSEMLCDDDHEFACTATLDNTQNIFYGMTQEADCSKASGLLYTW